MIASAYTAELADEAICHRNVSLGERGRGVPVDAAAGDKFAVAFELFINVGHGFVEAVGVPGGFWGDVLGAGGGGCAGGDESGCLG